MLESFESGAFEYRKLSKDEMDSRHILGRIVGPIADYKNPTRNGRKYTEKLWNKTFDDPIVKEKIENKCLYGELGHPEDRLDTDMSKICICMAEQPKKSTDGKLYGVFDILDTPNGRILKTLLDYGTTIGVSSRGEGDLISDYMGEEIVDPDTYQYECHDAVLLPAVKAARLTPVTESLHQGKTLKQALLEDLNRSSDNDKLVMNDTLESLGIDLTEGIQYKGYDMTITRSGVQLRKTDGSFIQEFPTEEEAREYVDEQTDSLNEADVAAKVRANQDPKEMTRRAIKMLKNLGGEWEDFAKEFKDTYGEDALDESLNEGDLKKSSIKDVNIKKESEKEEADNDGADLVAELQETMLKNADLEKLVKSLQERLSVCYAKEKRYEGQINTYKNSIKSLQENAKKATSLEERLNSLQEELNSCKSDISKKDQTISDLKESVKKSDVTLKEQLNSHKDKQTAAKEVIEELTSKINTLQEELEKTKSSKTASIKVLKETYTKKESDLNDKMSELQKDSSQKLKQLQEKLERANTSVNRYQDIARKAVNRYITEKANALGISSEDVKNRLGKTYSFNDIDRICENLSTNRLAINRLPFKVSQVSEVKMTESVKPSMPLVGDGDYIDDQLQGLVDRLK